MGKFVLVAEDDTDILNLVLAVLEDFGFRVGSTMGRDTLTDVRERKPDVLLLDYQMPGMDGVRIARQMHSDPETRHIPIIAMTAAGRAALVCQKMDAQGCLGKPFDIDHLVDVVNRLTHTTH
jgi:two-component system alkaline phosphatase synthesis response regulator PhoP